MLRQVYFFLPYETNFYFTKLNFKMNSFTHHAKSLLLMFALSLGLTLSSCSDDDESITITASDFTATIAENPTLGQVLGVVAATTNGGTVTFSVDESNDFNGAFAINESTGSLTVAQPAYFDFEENTEVTGTVMITNRGTVKEITVRVSVTNVNEVTIDNFSTTLAENSVFANQVIYAISTTSQAEGALIDYELLDVNPADALTIEKIMGGGNVAHTVKVGDANLFNFELYPTITATLRARSTVGVDFADATITITLTDVLETVQERLDDGETPKQIYNSNNSLLNDLYGKLYGGGIIATFNTANGTGIILAESKLTGGPFTQAQANTAANNLVLNGFDDWKLPTETEGNAMCATLGIIDNLFAPVAGVMYWGNSFCCGGGGAYNYGFANTGCSSGHGPTSTQLDAIAIRLY